MSERLLLSVTPGVLSGALERILLAAGIDTEIAVPGSGASGRYGCAIVTSREGVDADIVIELSELDGRRGTVVDREGEVIAEVVIDLTSIRPLIELIDRHTSIPHL